VEEQHGLGLLLCQVIGLLGDVLVVDTREDPVLMLPIGVMQIADEVGQMFVGGNEGEDQQDEERSRIVVMSPAGRVRQGKQAVHEGEVEQGGHQTYYAALQLPSSVSMEGVRLVLVEGLEAGAVLWKQCGVPACNPKLNGGHLAPDDVQCVLLGD